MQDDVDEDREIDELNKMLSEVFAEVKNETNSIVKVTEGTH